MPPKIPQVDPWIDTHEIDAVATVLKSGWLTEGPYCDEFSSRLNRLIGVPYGVFAPNGTLALVLGLMALGIGPGDEVLVPDITFIASANSVIMTGARPVMLEVEPITFQIDVHAAEQLVNDRTRAIMPVHLYGSACNMHAIMGFAQRHGLKVIEDAAQGIGVTYDGTHVGSFGDLGCFSFFSDKTITTGEGGYVTCRSEEVFENLRYLRNQGRLDRGTFIHPMLGFNFRITDMQAAIGLQQLNKLAEIIAGKLRVHSWYRELLGGIPQLRILGAEPLSTHVPFRCVLIAENAQALMQHLESRGIQTRGVFYPLHRQPCLSKYQLTKPSLEKREFPNADYAYDNGVCLPVYPSLERNKVRYITDTICEFYSSAEFKSH